MLSKIIRAGTKSNAYSPVPSTVPTPMSLLVRNVAKIFTNISGDEDAAAINVAPAMSKLHSSPAREIIIFS